MAGPIGPNITRSCAACTGQTCWSRCIPSDHPVSLMPRCRRQLHPGQGDPEPCRASGAGRQQSPGLALTPSLGRPWAAQLILRCPRYAGEGHIVPQTNSRSEPFRGHSRGVGSRAGTTAEGRQQGAAEVAQEPGVGQGCVCVQSCCLFLHPRTPLSVCAACAPVCCRPTWAWCTRVCLCAWTCLPVPTAPPGWQCAAGPEAAGR